MIQFEKVNIEYLVAVVFLGAALILGVIFGERELAGNIASGIVGYIGGRGVGNAISKAVEQQQQNPPPQENEAQKSASDIKPANKDAAEEFFSGETGGKQNGKELR